MAVDERLSVNKAAEFLGVHSSTLYRWRYDDRMIEGKDKPKHIRIGGRFYYKRSDLSVFLMGVAAQGAENEISLK